jgi:hypothetical protein
MDNGPPSTHDQRSRARREQGGLVSSEEVVNAVLSGQVSYDDLPDPEQALVRRAWESRDIALLAALDFTRTCPDCGHPYTSASPTCRDHSPRTEGQ